jgi:hypothetical protein
MCVYHNALFKKRKVSNTFILANTDIAESWLRKGTKGLAADFVF